MKSILEELYYGNEGLVEKIPQSEDFKKVQYEYDKLYEKLLESLNKEQQKQLNDLCDLTGGLEAETQITHFKAGFKFCLQLIMEGMGR